MDDYLLNKHGISLGRAISISEQRLEKLKSGREVCPNRIASRITRYFFCDPKYFKRDDLNLPPLDGLQIDESIASIQRDDFANEVQRYKNKNVIYRDYQILDHKRRIMLFFSLGLVIIPLLAYTGYCAYTTLNDRLDTMNEYKQDGLSNSQQKIEDKIHEDDSSAIYTYFTNVNIGTEIVKIGNISPSTSSFSVDMHAWMDFDIMTFHDTYCIKNNIDDSDRRPTDIASFYRDEYTLVLLTGTFSKGPDGVPDWMQCEDPSKLGSDEAIVYSDYLEEIAFYPGNTSSNNYPNRETMFILGNGDFIADSFSYENDYSYSIKNNSTGEIHYRHFTKFYFSGTIRKAFDNPRYPLESIQFHIYLLPMQFTTDYLRYVPTPTINITKEYWLSQGYTCSADDNVYVSGVSPYFMLAGGYRIIDKNSGYNGFVTRLNYYEDNNQQYAYRTQFEVLLRANRQGMSTFLKAFINLFSVVIWITIAFYSQSYQGENQLGMMGTGLFAAISSILVGLSMVSDAGIFSLITMINIFTLAVILIMTYQCITARSANVKKNRVLIAYNGIKLRILFILLTVCTAIMFIALSIISYIWAF